MRRLGFTLTELLISLAILGVIVMFAVPKLLNSEAAAEKKAIFKESISALSAIVYTGALQHKIVGTGLGSYFNDNLGYTARAFENTVSQLPFTGLIVVFKEEMGMVIYWQMVPFYAV